MGFLLAHFRAGHWIPAIQQPQAFVFLELYMKKKIDECGFLFTQSSPSTTVSKAFSSVYECLDFTNEGIYFKGRMHTHMFKQKKT